MATNVLMPQLGESIAEGTIVRWNKAVGDPVDRDEPLFEISTDKVDAEIPSPIAGVLTEIRVPAGETVPIDSVVAVIGQSAGESRTPASSPDEAGGAAAPHASASSAAAAGAADSAGAAAGHAPPVAPAQDGAAQARRGLSPLVRRLAREHGVDLSAVRGTGAGGRITKADVLQYVESRQTGARTEPLTTMRRRIAEHMAASRRTAAHAHTVFDVDFTRAARLRERRRADYEQAGAKLTHLAFIARAVLDALAEVPVVNASLDGDSIAYREDVGLGIAVALDDGLIVPVIRRAQGMSVMELSRAIADLAERARNRRLMPGDVEGGTFTITNHGSFGSLLGMPIINQPQLAILGVGVIEKRPVAVDDAIAVRLRAYLTLGFDHRIIDGAVADRFMAAVRRNIEQFDESLL